MRDEFAFINRVTPSETYQPSLVIGVGDDAAIYKGSSEYDEVICVDTMVEGVHFRRDTLTPLQVGKKALVANISDLAAMGAIPAYYLVSIAIPSNWSENELIELYKGMSDIAKTYKMDLIGGDTVSTKDALILSVTVIGRVERGRTLFRSNAKPGDIVFVTGTIGGAAAGLDILFGKGLMGPFTENEQVLVRSHQEPLPQVQAGRIFACSKSRIALNDISDGVASEANEIAEASQVQLEIDLDTLPFPVAMNKCTRRQKLDWALFGGEDYQLIGTIDKKDYPTVVANCAQFGISLTKIGLVKEGEIGVFSVSGEERLRLHKQGFNHFRRR
ncbi:thiamine-phosphate kinase [Bacillus solitudinis]|uniref:thiamine-phosphate kinase n=1 Tax=Bacillus solitudinis TaxID=2014074 RepID=UPI000C23B92F|nr:thiamine-phosphate kinase [Bacillus solitudinis]